MLEHLLQRLYGVDVTAVIVRVGRTFFTVRTRLLQVIEGNTVKVDNNAIYCMCVGD